MVLEGNAPLLEVMLQYSADKKGRILFFGDNYVTDCLAAQTSSNWDSICIMEELEELELNPWTNTTIWGEWRHDFYEETKIETFWYDYMKNHAAKIVSACDTKELELFYNNSL